MSISRIDFQGSVARTGDFSQLKQNEDNKVVTDQNAFQTEFKKEVDQKTNSVNHKENVDQQKEKHDAKEKGKNEYHGNGGSKRGQTQEELEKLAESIIGSDGRPLDMHISSGFDFKI
ncbi:hypothetical protein [Butyrivibrio sp. NC2002]|uniref:hypothetical protein n=1 Tax=Butyrivibrio sp. NC2002 TaxID=1410610 RepID=UPI00055A0D69|nr:hypothetical protein [Butyrivibrio sp. NC2002]